MAKQGPAVSADESGIIVLKIQRDCCCLNPKDLIPGSDTRSGSVSCRQHRKSGLAYAAQLRPAQVEYKTAVEGACDIDLIITNGNQLPQLIRVAARLVDQI